MSSSAVTHRRTAGDRSGTARPNRRTRIALGLVAALALLVPACHDADAAGPGASRPPADDRAGTTASAPNRPPTVTVAAEARAAVGATVRVPVTARDADGDPLTVDVAGMPAGARFDGAALSWTPEDAGTWPVEVTATDPQGAAGRATVALVARHPARPGLLLGLGDSVASGHGLSNRDYLTRDPCWRAEDRAYPALVHRDWVRPDAEYRLVACSGASAGDLRTAPVGGGPAGLADGGRLPQIEWAVRANPGLVTLTVGANDLPFVHPERAFVDGRLDDGIVDDALDRLASDLDAALGRLVAATDATIVVTTYHDPTASTPQGVDGCAGACFARAATRVVGELNAAIAAAVAAQPDERVVLADVHETFAGRGAPRPLGGSTLRSLDLPGALGPIGDALSATLPYCATSAPARASWVNGVDCVHPNRAGHEAYAEAVLAATAGAAPAERGAGPS